MIQEICAERDAPLIRVGQGIEVTANTATGHSRRSERSLFAVITPSGDSQTLELGLMGEHQIENATAAVATAETAGSRVSLSPTPSTRVFAKLAGPLVYR